MKKKATLLCVLSLILVGCGLAVYAAGFPKLAVAFISVLFAFTLLKFLILYTAKHVFGSRFFKRYDVFGEQEVNG